MGPAAQPLLDRALADLVLDTSGLNGAYVGLWMNSGFTPAPTDTFATYNGSGSPAGEANFTGYARQSVTGWAAPSAGATGHRQTIGNVVSFANTSGSTQTVYGFWVMDNSQANLLGAVKFIAGYLLADGSSLPIIPVCDAVSQ
jgi:hypothetical protein